MTDTDMNAFVLHDTSDANGALRWGTSATLIVAAHAALIALGMAWYTQRPPPGVTLPTIMVDMAPATASPQPTPMDIAPGPVMQEADASPPVETAKPETVPEQLEATPPQLAPEVVAPPEAKPDPTPPKPEPARIVPEPAKPVQEKPKPVRKEAKKPTEAPPAPRTAAPPRAERQAPAASAISAGASAAAVASYNQTRRRPPAALQATPGQRDGCGPAGDGAGELYLGPRRAIAVQPACGFFRPRGARRRGAGDAEPRPAVSGVPAGYQGCLA